MDGLLIDYYSVTLLYCTIKTFHLKEFHEKSVKSINKFESITDHQSVFQMVGFALHTLKTGGTHNFHLFQNIVVL